MNRTHQEGRDARDDGKWLSDCPYTILSHEESSYAYWQRGWIEREREIQNENQRIH